MTSSDGQSGESKVQATSPPPEAPEWVRELNGVQALIDRGDYESADAALDALERRRPEARGWAAYMRAILCVNSRSAEETLAAIERALAEESLGQSGKLHLSELLVQHYGEASDTRALRLTMHEMLNDGVADANVLNEIKQYAERHNLTDVLARLRSGLTGAVSPHGVSWFQPTTASAVEGGTSAEPIPVFECTDVTLVHRELGLYVFDSEGNLLRDCATSTTAEAVEAARSLAEPRAGLSVEGTAVLIHGGPGHPEPNYCHWILDWLPRLEIARASAPAWDFVIGHDLTATFQIDSLELVGTRPDCFIPMATNPVLRVEHLLVPDTCFRMRHPLAGANPALLAWWRSLAVDQVGPIEPRGDRLYLWRQGARRSVREERNLRLLLERYGFRTLEPGDLPFWDQIDALRGASAVVAPHGAGLTNILFAPNECRLLELFSSRGGSRTYEWLATALGQDYAALRDHGSTATFAARHNAMAITVDLDAVEEWVLSVSQ
jgi:capsular polysaccharide biosynthesis protein